MDSFLKKIKSSFLELINSTYFILLVFSLFMTAISYISINTSSQIYDYNFHLGRIVGLAQSIRNNDLLPNLNFSFVHNAGYAVPMFYGNWILYPSAVVFILTKIGTLAFATYAFIIMLLTSYSAYFSVYHITGSSKRAYAFALVSYFIYPYFGYGMTAVVPFVPILIYCLYKVLFLKRYNPILLAVIISLLVQTHIISTIVLAITSILFVLLNYQRISLRTIVSFLISIVMAILLSIGFIFQYLEQNSSEILFVQWGLRDFPFPSSALMNSSDIVSMMKDFRYPVAILSLILVILFWKTFSVLSKQLIIVAITLLVFASGFLPWNNILKFTFLSVFQYTGRLIFFVPILIFLSIVLSGRKYFVVLVCGIQVIFFLVNYPLSFLPSSANYAKQFGLVSPNIVVMRNQNQRAVNTYYNPQNETFDTSGDEYFVLDVNHDEVRNGAINNFEYQKSDITIDNIKQSYNNLEFDVHLSDHVKNSRIVVPRVWYKGYVAKYTAGATGSQPYISYVKLNKDELRLYKEQRKPFTKYKALYSGRITIDVSHSGHVVIRYEKTKIQFIGYLLELLSWLAIGIISLFYVHKNQSREIQ